MVLPFLKGQYPPFVSDHLWLFFLFICVSILLSQMFRAAALRGCGGDLFVHILLTCARKFTREWLFFLCLYVFFHHHIVVYSEVVPARNFFL